MVVEEVLQARQSSEEESETLQEEGQRVLQEEVPLMEA